jgi:dUTP pyrophosphatase
MIRICGRVTRAHETDSGFDLHYSGPDLVMGIGNITLLDTDVKVEMPIGIEAQVRGRSGNALKGLWISIGTIDSGYRGNIGVIAANLSGRLYPIRKGDRIAQLVFGKVETQVHIVAKIQTDSDRGTNGFGSTGA